MSPKSPMQEAVRTLLSGVGEDPDAGGPRRGRPSGWRRRSTS